MYQEKCLSTKLIKQSDWSMVSSNEHMNHGRVRPELDRTKISKQAYSHCNTTWESWRSIDRCFLLLYELDEKKNK